MSHNLLLSTNAQGILSARMLANKTKSWHGLETIVHDVLPVDGWNMVGADIKVSAHDLKFTYKSKVVTTGNKVIVRNPLKDVEGMVKDPSGGKKKVYMGDDAFKALPPVQFGVVSADYVLITPDQAVEICQKAVLNPDGTPRTIETMGLLGNGSRMFITFELPSLSVKGVDEVRSYVVFYTPTMPGETMTVVRTKTRVVCENTFRMAMGNATQRALVPHTLGAEKRIEEQLHRLYTEAAAAIGEEQRVIDLFGSKTIDKATVKLIAEAVWRVPPQPNREWFGTDSYDSRMKEWERQRTWCEETQNLAADLFESPDMLKDGDYIQPELMGTAYCGLQAFAKVETYRKGQAEAIVSGLIAGDRGRQLDAAFTGLLAVVK